MLQCRKGMKANGSRVGYYGGIGENVRRNAIDDK